MQRLADQYAVKLILVMVGQPVQHEYSTRAQGQLRIAPLPQFFIPPIRWRMVQGQLAILVLYLYLPGTYDTDMDC